MFPIASGNIIGVPYDMVNERWTAFIWQFSDMRQLKMLYNITSYSPIHSPIHTPTPVSLSTAVCLRSTQHLARWSLGSNLWPFGYQTTSLPPELPVDSIRVVAPFWIQAKRQGSIGFYKCTYSKQMFVTDLSPRCHTCNPSRGSPQGHSQHPHTHTNTLWVGWRGEGWGCVHRRCADIVTDSETDKGQQTKATWLPEYKEPGKWP